MGCGASVATTNSNQPIRRPIDASQHDEVSKGMAAVQGSAKTIYDDYFEHFREKQIIQIDGGHFTEDSPKLIESDDVIEFQTIDDFSYDVIQVYQDGDDFYEVPNGFHFYGLDKRTDTTKSQFILSLNFEEKETSICFGIMKSTPKEKSTKQRKFPKIQCEQNLLVIRKPEFSFDLTDDKINQKVYLHQSDQIEFKWSSNKGIAYRIEERKYCPVSGGFYTVDKDKNESSRRGKIRGQFTRRFEDLGTSFFCRLTDNNEIYDVTICIVTGTHNINRIEFQENAIKPYSIEIEQGHSIEFVWSTKRKLTFYQIDSFRTDAKSRKSIKLNKDEENFFWPFDPSRRGQFYFQFPEPGIFRFKVENDQIGTILVTPRKRIHRISFPTDEFVRKLNTNDFVLFEWNISELKDDKVSIMIDPDTSVIPDDANGLRGLYRCSDHRCSSGRNELSQCFQTSEVLLMDFPKHGLFQLSHLQRTDTTLFSLIVENGIDNHYAEYDERRIFVDKTIVVNQNDRVWFESSNKSQIGFIYQTDEFGQRLNSIDLIFEPQRNSVNNFYKQFDQLGIFYFSVDFTPEKIWKNTSTPVTPLAVVVTPDIKFHYNFISKDHFENEPISTNVTDFVIWQFENPISHNVVQLSSKSTMNDLNDCHNLAKAGRNRQCLGLECIRPGAFFFANPEFERFAGTDEGRLLSTVIIDVPFGEKCFVVSKNEFLPEILHVAEGQTISWILSSDRDNHRITVKPENDQTKRDEKTLIDRDFATFLNDVHYLHTFHHVGRYEIRSDAFPNAAIVSVETEKSIQNQRKRVLPPEIRPPLEMVSEAGQKIRLVCSNRTANIYYSLDGSMPTRFTGNVLKYNDEESLVLNEPGLQVVRAFAFEEEKVLSDVTTSTPTYVMQNAEIEATKERENLWANTRLSLAVSLEKPNKIYGKIQVEPSTILDLVDHFEFFVNDVEQSVRLASDELHFSAQGFAGGEQYEVYVVACPKSNLVDSSPILSNKRAFEIQRELPSGGPLLSLSVPNDLTSIVLIWANIGDHIDEYVLHVDNVPTKIISEENFQDSFGIQLLGAEHNRNYLFHIEAKIRENQRTCKSNVLSIRLPLQRSVAETSDDQRVPYLTVVKERPPSDGHFEEIQLSQSIHRPKQRERPYERLPITTGFRNAVPKISYKRNRRGTTLILTEKTTESADFAENYRIIVDGAPYGKLIAPRGNKKFQLSLMPGNHECFLEVIPTDRREETYKSNLLKINVVAAAAGTRGEPQATTEQSNVPIHSVLDRNDLPVTRLVVQRVNTTSIRAKWTLDRALPRDAFVAIYELHIRGQNFIDQLNSDEKFERDGLVEHIWNLTEDNLEIPGVSEPDEYTLFVRTFYHVKGLTDIEYVVTESAEVTPPRIDLTAEFLPRPLLNVTKLDVQMALLSWRLPETDSASLVKGYRLFLNSKPTELFSANQNSYELKNLRPGTSNEVQVAVTGSSNYTDDQYSEPIRIECPQRPSAPEVEVIRAEKPFSISIQWKLRSEEQDAIESFKVFLNNELHGTVKTSGRQTFKYEFTQLNADQTYSIYVKSFVASQRLDGNSHQCSIESNASKEISRRCAAPPKGTMPRIERMDPQGVHLEWDEPEKTEEINLTGYQILKDNRAIGKPLPVNQRRASINELEVGNQYAFQVLPLTDQTGATKLRTGEAYDPNRHGYFLPGPKLDVAFTDLIQLPKKIEVENVTGDAAMLCWSPIDRSSSSHVQPEFYNIKIWNNTNLNRETPKVIKISKTDVRAPLTDLQSETVYFVQMEACQKRRHPVTNDHYLVVSTTEVIPFQTGAPPRPPATMRLIASTNTAARLTFDPFVEHREEIIQIRVDVKENNVNGSNIRLPSVILTPDQTEVILRNLNESTKYSVTLYPITQHYLNEIGCPDENRLPDDLPSSNWLPSKTFDFTTSGCKRATGLKIIQSTVRSIKLEWRPAETTGSTEILGQTLRWKSIQTEEQQQELSRAATSATIPGILPSGRYTIYLDTKVRYQVNLEDAQNENNQRESRLTSEITTNVVFTISNDCDAPELYVTGYTKDKISLEWEKPEMFKIIDHPEKVGEKIKIHRQLIGYVFHSQILNGQTNENGTTIELPENQMNAELTQGRAGCKYQVALKAKTILRSESTVDPLVQNQNESNEPEESKTKEIQVQQLKESDFLQSLNAKLFSYSSGEDSQKKRIDIEWKVSKKAPIDSFVLRWYSKKNSEVRQKSIDKIHRGTSIDVEDLGFLHTFYLDIVREDDKSKVFYPPIHLLVPGAPDPPQLFLVGTNDTSFTLEWSEPQIHGNPIIGYQLFISGKKLGEMIRKDVRRVEIPSRINRTYQAKICALTDDPACPRSEPSSPLIVITTPTTDLVPTMSYHNDDGNIASFDRTVARIIPVQIEPINEEKLHITWTSFLPTTQIHAYYIHHTCLNTGEIQAMKVSKRFREAVLRDLRPGFTYGIIVLAVDKNGAVLYTSDKTTVQMDAPPNAPIVAISERTHQRVRVDWRPATSYGILSVVGYKIFVNNRLAAILSEEQLSYTLTNGSPCDSYTIQVQALSKDTQILSPMSRPLKFTWPGIKPGAFRRVDDGQTGTILLSWEHPKFEDDAERLIAFRLISENILTREIRDHGEFDAGVHQASIYDLSPGKYRLWLEIRGEIHRIRARPITAMLTRANSSLNRTISFDSTRYLRRGQHGFRQPIASGTTSGVRRSRY